MQEPSRIKLDNGAANDRILSKESAPDYRRVEQASIKQRARLESPEVKRLFVRFFHTLQLNGHFVSDIARTRLAPEEVEKVEAMIRLRLEALAKEIDTSIDGAAALFEREVLTTTASYDTQPLEMEVGVVSSFGRRYLEALLKLDRLMPMLKTLEIYEVISMGQADKQRALLKRHVRDVASTARRLANGLRRRMSDELSRGVFPTKPNGLLASETHDGDGVSLDQRPDGITALILPGEDGVLIVQREVSGAPD